jgi:uncharacterized protein YybS (DUF2232 family)
LSRNIKTSSLTEAALITGIMIIFAMVGNFIFPFIDFIYPLPAIILAKRHDYKIAIMALVSAGTIILMTLGLQMGLYYIVLYTPMSAVMGYFISRNRRPFMAVLSGGVVYLVSFLILILIMQAFLSINLVEYVRETFVESLKMQESFMSNFGASEEQLQASKNLYDSMIETIITLLPTVIIFSSLSMSYINYFVAARFGHRLGVEIVPMQDFSMFKLPRNISWGMLIFLLGTYLVSFTDFVNSDALSANILFIMQMLFLIQGLAVVKFMLTRRQLPKFFRVLTMVLIIVNSYLTFAAILVGLTDMIVDFRKIKKYDRW